VINFTQNYIEYLKNNQNKYWFKRKLYGWGWTPARWQGWAVLVVWIAVNIFLFRRIDFASHSGSDTLISFTLPLLISVAVLIAICYKTGESPRWQWGEHIDK
jgi:uncharacterized membrane protein YhaH (DUF805 family)